MALSPTKIFRNKEGKWEENEKLQNTYDNKMHVEILRMVNIYAEKKLNCHVVNMPDMQFVMGDLAHRWGGFPLHYTQSVYEYFYEDICEVVFNESYKEEKMNTFQKIKWEYFWAISEKDIHGQMTNAGSMIQRLQEEAAEKENELKDKMAELQKANEEIHEWNMKWAETDHELQNKNEQLDLLGFEYERVIHSISYRIGRISTWMPRKVRRIIKGLFDIF